MDPYQLVGRELARLVPRADGRVQVVDASTGRPLGVLDDTCDPPVPFFQGVMFAMTAVLVIGVVALVCFNIGRAMGAG